MNRRPGPLGKLFGWLLLALPLGALAMVHYYAFVNPTGGRTRGLLADVPPQYVLIFMDILIFGGLFLGYRFARKHERAMRDAGFEPGEVAETYWEAYLLRMKAQAVQDGGNFRRNMQQELAKRVVGLGGDRALSAAEIAAAVRQATPVPGARPPAELMGTWTSTPDASLRPGWTAQVELREAGEPDIARLWLWTASGMHDDGESAASVREGFVEVKRESGGEVRVVRLTPGTAPDCVDVNEYRYPSGKPRNMQAHACVLRKLRA